MTGPHSAAPDPADLLLGMEEEDEDGAGLMVMDIHGAGFKEAKRSMQSISTKAGKRAERHEATRARASLLDDLLAGGDDAGDLGGGGQPGAAQWQPAGSPPGGDSDGEAGGEGEAGADLAHAQEQLHAIKAEVDKVLDEAMAAGGAQQQAGPEPPRWRVALAPVQALPTLQLQSAPEVQQVLSQQQQLLGLDLPGGDAASRLQAEAFVWLLRQGGAPLDACPSEEAARLLFEALCYADRATAGAAYQRLAAWCGAPELAAGAELPGAAECWGVPTSGSGSSSSSGRLPLSLSLAGQRPAVTIKWLPSAADLLQALATLGCTAAAPAAAAAAAANTRAGHSKRSNKAAQPPSQSPQQEAHADEEQLAEGDGRGQAEQPQQQSAAARCRYDHLPLLLRLLGLLCRGHAAGRLDLSGPLLGDGRFKELLLAVTSLLLDEAAQVACRCVLPDALAALLEVPDASQWDRLLPGLLESMLALGPSHRATVALLAGLPPGGGTGTAGGSRGVVLRQWGALHLLAQLVPGAPKQPPPGRGASANTREVKQQLAGRLLKLLGSKEGARKLVVALSGPSKGQQQQQQQQQLLQEWTLMSILDAADLLLWVDVSKPGTGVGPDVRDAFMAWLDELGKCLKRKHHSHLPGTRVAAMYNTYEYAKYGSVAFGEPAGRGRGGEAADDDF